MDLPYVLFTQACRQQDVGLFVQVQNLDDDEDDRDKYDEFDAEADAMDAVGPADVAAINTAEDKQPTENDLASLSAAAVNFRNGAHHVLACDVKFPGIQAILLPCESAVRAFTGCAERHCILGHIAFGVLSSQNL